jgi:hypothetical protein
MAHQEEQHMAPQWLAAAAAGIRPSPPVRTPQVQLSSQRVGAGQHLRLAEVRVQMGAAATLAEQALERLEEPADLPATRSLMVPAALVETQDHPVPILWMCQLERVVQVAGVLAGMVALVVPQAPTTIWAVQVELTEGGKGVIRIAMARRPVVAVVAATPVVAAAESLAAAAAAVPIWYLGGEAWPMGMEARALS